MRMDEQDFKVKFTRRFIIGAAGTIALNGAGLLLPEKWASAESIKTCLLYTSPSPRD